MKVNTKISTGKEDSSQVPGIFFSLPYLHMTEDTNKLSTQAISISGDMVTATAVPHEEKRYTLVRWNDSSGQVE